MIEATIIIFGSTPDMPVVSREMPCILATSCFRATMSGRRDSTQDRVEQVLVHPFSENTQMHLTMRTTFLSNRLVEPALLGKPFVDRAGACGT